MLQSNLQDKKAWSFPKRTAIVFIIVYLLLYMFPEPFVEIPGLTEVLKMYTLPMEWLILWFGKTVLGIAALEKIAQTGSGDTTFDYFRILMIFILSIVITILITVLSKRKEYHNWFHFTWVYARYYLGIFLLIYGFIKLFEGQFPAPYLGRLEQNYGDSSPMGLMWTFMGASKSYTFFAGMMEFVAGLLLLFRRTTIAGGIMAFGVMLNVAVMNYCYDVCVKLFSTHLVLLSIFVLSPYLKSLFNFIFLQKSTQIKIEPIVFRKKWLTTTRKVIKALILLICGVMMVVMYFETYTSEPAKNYTKSFDGSYKIISITGNDNALLPSQKDTLRWAKFLIEDGFFAVKTITDRRIRFEAATDTVNHKITLTSVEDSTKTYQFKYQFLPNKKVVFKGRFESDSLDITAIHKKKSDYRLNKTPFKWISEYPYNR